jgi:hypothetical protein
MFRRTAKLVLLGVVIGSLAFGVAYADKDKDMGKDKAMKSGEDAESHGNNQEVTMTGEVLDMYCFMNHPDDGQGADHAKCAKTCINKGLPIGFMSGGEVYLIVGKDHESAAGMVAEYAGAQSTITGTLIKHHGMKAIELASIKPAS